MQVPSPWRSGASPELVDALKADEFAYLHPEQCPVCRAERRVCDVHADQPINDTGCECGEGTRCANCNPCDGEHPTKMAGGFAGFATSELSAKMDGQRGGARDALRQAHAAANLKVRDLASRLTSKNASEQ